MNKTVVIYPSGFVGYNVGWPAVKTAKDFSPQAALARFGNDTSSNKLVIVNPVLEALFTQWRTRTRKTNDADFCGDIIAAVGNAFGTDSFYEWCHMQMLNPYFTAYHRQYLNETLEFIFNAKPRSTGYPTWIKLLVPTLAHFEDSKEHFKYQDIMLKFGMDKTGVRSVIQTWISKPKGIDDMLVTACLLFGEGAH